MAKKTNSVNFRVVVEPKQPWSLYQGGPKWEEKMRRKCEEVIAEIHRHVDGVDSVHAEWDTEEVCEHCGWGWTEDGSAYNGGCCAEDEEANPGNAKSAQS